MGKDMETTIANLISHEVQGDQCLAVRLNAEVSTKVGCC